MGDGRLCGRGALQRTRRGGDQSQVGQWVECGVVGGWANECVYAVAVMVVVVGGEVGCMCVCAPLQPAQCGAA